MASILIRPEDLAVLAQRFDAVADDLSRAGRRLARARSDVALNRDDQGLPLAGLTERAGLVEANLRRLADEFRVDAGLMAQTVEDAEFDAEGRWTAGLETGSAGSMVSSWSTVANDLSSVVGSDAGGRGGEVVAMTVPGPVGGLFVAASIGDGAAWDVLDVVTDRLAAAPAPSGSPAELWPRIVDGLFET